MNVHRIVSLGVIGVTVLAAVYMGYNRSYSLSHESPVAENIRDARTGYQHYVAETHRVGIAEAARQVRENVERGDTYTSTHCHYFMHAIGNAAVAMYPTLAGALAHGDDYCSYGYQHGVLQVYSERTGLPELMRTYTDVCDSEFAGYMNEKYSSCVHGLSHAVTNMLDLDYQKAIELCERYSLESARTNCIRAVFMEYTDVRSLSMNNPRFPEDPLFPCNDVDSAYDKDCFQYTIYIPLVTNDHNYAATFEVCNGVRSDAARHSCNRGLGRIAMSENWDNSGAIATAKCFEAQSREAQADCMGGVTSRMLTFNKSLTATYAHCETLPQQVVTQCKRDAYDYFLSKYCHEPELANDPEGQQACTSDFR